LTFEFAQNDFYANDPKSVQAQHPTPLRLFKKQSEFAYSPSHTTFMAGGWGSGKSTAGIGFCLASMLDNISAPQTGLIIEPTAKLVREFIYSKFIPAFRHHIIGQSKMDNTIFLRHNIRVIYISGHDPSRIEQVNATWALLDEAGLMRHSVVMKAAGRVREGKRLRIGYCGVPYFGWMQKEFEGRDDKMRKILHASTTDNPHLPKEYIDNLYESCPARLQKAYLHGHFVPQGAVVYPEFDKQRHVVDWEYDSNLKTGISIDWSARTPYVMFFQMLEPGVIINGEELKQPGVVIIDELVPDGTQQSISTPRLMMLIKNKKIPIHCAVADPAGKGTQSTSGTSDLNIAKKHLGIHIERTTDPGLRLISTGIDHVKQMLEPLSGPPRLYFSKKLLLTHSQRGVINAIQAYSYKEDRDSNYVDENPIKDSVSDHACDALRYLCIRYFKIIRLQTRIYSLR
jgi:phage terminase large subunit